MLSMTKKTGYGIIAMLHLARLADGKLASAREIAEEYMVPHALLMNVLKTLCASGYVTSVRGAKGGYSIDRDPANVNFVGLMEALEGPMKLAECITNKIDDDDPTNTCDLRDTCPIRDPIHRVHRHIRDFLTTLTLKDIMEETAGQIPPLPKAE
ncbi:MAG: Rrf2 family transcriptional regulator [Phycisphaerales bacterium]|jgi:Rrf2 family protein|nr:Rrf2 family transcriptional regulator [Phycisphaerales bacterium]MBT7171336.1 Rrf2 family transcriptional regulator [Phycisphaerales bacterium]